MVRSAQTILLSPLNDKVELYTEIRTTQEEQKVVVGQCIMRTQRKKRGLKIENRPISAKIVEEAEMIPVLSCLCTPIKVISLSFRQAKSPNCEIVSRR